MSRFMNYETIVNVAIQNARIMAVCTYPVQASAMCGCRELIHNHGNIFVKRGEWVHDRSKEAAKHRGRLRCARSRTSSRGC